MHEKYPWTTIIDQNPSSTGQRVQPSSSSELNALPIHLLTHAPTYDTVE